MLCESDITGVNLMDILEYRRRYRNQLIKLGCLPGVADDAAEECEFEDSEVDYTDPEADATREAQDW